MAGIKIQRNVFLSSLVIGAVWFTACTLILQPAYLNVSDTSCSSSDLVPFDGCYRNTLTGHYIVIRESVPSTDSVTCSEYVFSGHGSGVFGTSGEIWPFTGALIDSTTASLHSDTASMPGIEVPDNTQLEYDSDTMQMAVLVLNEDGTPRIRSPMDPCP